MALRSLAFVGGGWARDPVGFDSGETTVASAGVGVEMGLTASPVRLRIDLPFWVSDPAVASSVRGEEGGFRLQLGFSPAPWN